MRHLLALFVLLAPSARAASPSVHLEYEAYVAGLSVISVKSDVAMGREDYGVEIGYRTHGLVDAFFHADLHSTAKGAFEGLLPRPQRFTAWGAFRGTARQTLIDYPDNDPVVKVLEPPNDKERDTVPLDQRPGTVDTLSALAMLVHTVIETNRCDGKLRVFDGRRLSEISARTAAMETLESDKDSRFAGPALRYDFVGRMLAGFIHDEDRATQAEPQEGTAWLASPGPGLPLLPVRIRFHLHFFGYATAYLTEVRATP